MCVRFGSRTGERRKSVLRKTQDAIAGLSFIKVSSAAEEEPKWRRRARRMTQDSATVNSASEVSLTSFLKWHQRKEVVKFTFSAAGLRDSYNKPGFLHQWQSSLANSRCRSRSPFSLQMPHASVCLRDGAYWKWGRGLRRMQMAFQTSFCYLIFAALILDGHKSLLATLKLKAVFMRNENWWQKLHKAREAFSQLERKRSGSLLLLNWWNKHFVLQSLEYRKK